LGEQNEGPVVNAKRLTDPRDEIAAECSNRIFAVTDPENEASCGLFAKLGYRKMILWEKKVEPRA